MTRPLVWKVAERLPLTEIPFPSLTICADQVSLSVQNATYIRSKKDFFQKADDKFLAETLLGQFKFRCNYSPQSNSSKICLFALKEKIIVLYLSDCRATEALRTRIKPYLREVNQAIDSVTSKIGTFRLLVRASLKLIVFSFKTVNSPG